MRDRMPSFSAVLGRIAAGGLARGRMRFARSALTALLFALLLSLPGVAGAQEPGALPTGMGVSISAALSTNPTSLPWGWTAVIVSITNSGSAPARGEARVELRQFGNKR